MVDASTFDAENTEPIERLPRLSLGEYSFTVDKTQHNEGFSGEYFIVEGTVSQSTGEKALVAGQRFCHMIKLDVSKKAIPYMIRRVKGFIYPALGRRNIQGEELFQLLDDSSVFEGKSLKARCANQEDEDGNPKLNDEGEPWTEVTFSAA